MKTKFAQEKKTNKQKQKPSEKKKYKIRNWPEYNKSLVRRGSLEFWIEQGMIKNWEVKIIPEKRKKGAQTKYSDHAIETTCLIGKVFHQRLRQTEGMVRSVFKMVNLKLDVPNYSTLSRRGGSLQVKLPKKDKDKVMAILDSTGLKVYGEGEWKVRKHGYSKRRTWLKLHLSIDADGEIRASLITSNDIDDAQAGVALLSQQQADFADINRVSADGAYDKRKMYDACINQRIKEIIIPPRKGARIWFHGNCKKDPHPRDQNLRTIRKTSRQKWKIKTGYHKRSLVENTMYRRKIIFGDKVNSRKKENQITEIMLTLKALNIMMHNGMPDSYAVT